MFALFFFWRSNFALFTYFLLMCVEVDCIFFLSFVLEPNITWPPANCKRVWARLYQQKKKLVTAPRGMRSFFFPLISSFLLLGRKWTVSHFQHTVLLLSFFVNLLILRCCMHLWRRRPMSGGWKKNPQRKKNQHVCLSFLLSKSYRLPLSTLFFFYCSLFIVCDLFNFPFFF